MNRIALATYQALPCLTPGDQLIQAALIERGVQAEAVVWDSSRVDWEKFDGVVIRSCWDYHLKLNRFLDWLEALEQQEIPIWNSPSTIRWNCDKAYLRDLKNKGIPVVPTVWLDKDSGIDLEDFLITNDWPKAVIKPTVSASAYRTKLVQRENVHEGRIFFEQSLNGGTDFLIQKYMSEIESKGEWSLVFLNGRYSYAVLKKPKPGDFRVQHEYGGTIEKKEPPPRFIEQAKKILHASNQKTLYARVDGVEVGRDLVLMELELIEPELFLIGDPELLGKYYPNYVHQIVEGLIY